VSPAAVAAGVASAVGYAGWILVGRSVSRQVGPWHMLFYGLLVGAVAWSLYVPPWQAYLRPYTPFEWVLILYIVAFATVTPFALFLYGLRFIDSQGASLTATLEPVVAALAAALWLGEALTGRQVLGAAVILSSVIALQIAPPPAGEIA
jgi:drug/metabolite transporter (DMT)-like permease